MQSFVQVLTRRAVSVITGKKKCLLKPESTRSNDVNDAPIGIFDSGVGGLTVARAILDQLPGERLLYIGDTANSPYGPKPLEQVRSMALNVMDELVDSGVKMLVIACNTATAAALDEARERYTKGWAFRLLR